MQASSPKSGSGNTMVARRIAQVLPSLTRAHRRMADHVLAHPLQVATQPIDELAASIGVSVATANRFARALGFDGYATFRAELVRGFEPLLAPVQELRDNLAQPGTVAEVFMAVLDESQRNIEATRRSLDHTACEEAVRRILAARTTAIVGFGASAWLAGLLHHGLESYCADVRLLAGPGGVSQAARALAQRGPEDLLVAMAFPRYLNDTVTLAREARSRGVQVLALTDRPSSPLAPLADVVLYAQTATRYRPNCETGALALVEALSSAVALRAPGAYQMAGKVVDSVAPWLHGGPARQQPAATRLATTTTTAASSSKRSR